MKAIGARITRGLPIGSRMETCDNSGAKVVKIISIKNMHSTKGRRAAATVGDLVFVSVVKGKPDIRKQVVPAIIVRQRMPYKRRNGMTLQFEDNSIVILKDEDGNPKGTIFKGPIAKEAADRWPAVAKVARIIL